MDLVLTKSLGMLMSSTVSPKDSKVLVLELSFIRSSFRQNLEFTKDSVLRGSYSFVVVSEIDLFSSLLAEETNCCSLYFLT